MKPTIPQELQRRSVGLRSDAVTDEGSGGFSGTANVMGRIDAYRSCIFPGAFSKVLKSYVTSGAILFGHDWWSPEIGMPMDAQDRGKTVEITAEFHDDEEAQRIRGIVTKRLKAKKTVELSVGFWPEWEHVADFENGADLLAYARGRGCDMSLFDPEIASYEGWCWAIPEVRAWAETSIVHKAATPGSAVSDARGVMNDLSRGVLAASLTDHLEMVLAANRGVASRLLRIRDQRVEEGRESLRGRATDIDALIRDLTELRDSVLLVDESELTDLDRQVDNFIVDLEIALLST